MALRSLLGLSSKSKKLFLPLMIFLGAILLMVRATRKTATDIPPDFKGAMIDVFAGSDYPASCRDNWMAVAKMETATNKSGPFSSTLYVQSNNPWGMGYAPGRENAQSGRVYATGDLTHAFASYQDLADASKDIILWMDAAGFPKGNLSLREHVDAMGSVKTGSYYGDQSADSYYNLVLQWLNK